MFDIKEFLAMSEDELYRWLLDNDYIIRASSQSLADLAFQLRDEVIMLKGFPFIAAQVYNHVHGYKPNKGEIHAPIVMMWIWFASHAKPEHWIAAALAAKETK